MSLTVHKNAFEASRHFRLFHCTGGEHIEPLLCIRNERVVVSVVAEVVDEGFLNRHK